jgi:hypothetical protein
MSQIKVNFNIWRINLILTQRPQPEVKPIESLTN